MKLKNYVIFLFIFYLIFTTTTCEEIYLSIPGQGAVIGSTTQSTWTNQTILQFLGVPYAESPSGNRRFQPPVPKENWPEVLDTRRYPPRCPELTTLSQNSKKDKEDCLNLSIYTKNTTGKYPIMFYLYGGGFLNGSSSDHPPNYLLEKDIVLIVPQYRVGALGWLSTHTQQIPGNAAFMDIILALEWVQKYAHVFGGDPSQVTVFAQSAGAISAGLLTLSPKVPKNLFHKVIMQSASVYLIDAEEHSLKMSNKFCQRAKCNCLTIAQINECMVKLPVKKLLEISSDVQYAMSTNDFYGYVPMQPIKMRPQTPDRKIPVMAGVTKHDGTFLLSMFYNVLMRTYKGNPNPKIDLTKEFDKIFRNLKFKDPNGVLKQLMRTEMFPNGELVNPNYKLSIPGFIEICNVFMKSPVLKLLQKYWDDLYSYEIYLYSFDYEGEHTRFGYEFGNEWYPFEGGVHHSNDNIYLFATHHLNVDDTLVAMNKVDLWTSFAIEGQPSVNGRSMPKFNGVYGPFFKVGKEITIGDDFHSEFTSTVRDPNRNRFIRN